MAGGALEAAIDKVAGGQEGGVGGELIKRATVVVALLGEAVVHSEAGPSAVVGRAMVELTVNELEGVDGAVAQAPGG